MSPTTLTTPGSRGSRVPRQRATSDPTPTPDTEDVIQSQNYLVIEMVTAAWSTRAVFLSLWLVFTNQLRAAVALRLAATCRSCLATSTTSLYQVRHTRAQLRALGHWTVIAA